MSNQIQDKSSNILSGIKRRKLSEDSELISEDDENPKKGKKNTKREK